MHHHDSAPAAAELFVHDVDHDHRARHHAVDRGRGRDGCGDVHIDHSLDHVDFDDVDQHDEHVDNDARVHEHDDLVNRANERFEHHDDDHTEDDVFGGWRDHDTDAAERHHPAGRSRGDARGKQRRAAAHGHVGAAVGRFRSRPRRQRLGDDAPQAAPGHKPGVSAVEPSRR
jgi:hypothetical protein